MRLSSERRIVRSEKGRIELLETKFNVGDIVKIKYHTESEKNDYPFYWSGGMNKWENQTFVIKEIQNRDKGPRTNQKIKAYKLENNICTWHESSFIKIGKKYQTF